jgi:dynactin 1
MSRLSINPNGPFEVGQRVWTADGRAGTVRYSGPTEFAPGEWIGVDLDEALGKNNGSVNDKEYFKCEQSHGMFVKASLLTLKVSDIFVPALSVFSS